MTEYIAWRGKAVREAGLETSVTTVAGSISALSSARLGRALSIGINAPSAQRLATTWRSRSSEEGEGASLVMGTPSDDTEAETDILRERLGSSSGATKLSAFTTPAMLMFSPGRA